MQTYGFLRVAAACPDLRVADTAFNAGRTLDLLAKADGQGANLVVFPEMGLTGYTCYDLFHTLPLQRAAEAALAQVIEKSAKAFRGVAVLVNLSASNEVIGKASYRGELVGCQSGRCIAGYIYTSAGVGESSTDLVFGGHCLIAENGTIVAESPRFRPSSDLLVADLDLDHLRHDRIQTNSFNDNRRDFLTGRDFRRISFELDVTPRTPALVRFVDAHPFVPQDPRTLKDRCDEIFHTQVSGLAKRLRHIDDRGVSIGISGGLDSTLALLVACKTVDALGAPRERIKALTMPGFGTTSRTKTNAHALMRALKVTFREVDIRAMCFDQMKGLGHAPFGLPLDGETIDSLGEKLRHLPPERRSDLVFENVQARVRTSLLMNAGFVIGTGDISELALGWTTYNADHMSMYNPNISIPKTLVKFLVRWVAENEFDGDVRRTLPDIVGTEISPELLPPDAAGKIAQSTESTIGPYELV